MKMNDFLKKIASDIKNNDREYTREDFYYLLKYVGVKKDISLVEDVEKFYQGFLESLSNSLVKYEVRNIKSGKNVTHYLGFYVDKKANYALAYKVYFPVKYEYLISALKTIFLYLVRNNIQATVKFHVKATNEGIVIRFYKKEDVLPFINYCNNNFILADLLARVHPFIATIYGIGIVQDDNTVNTYNGTLSMMLEEYFTLLVKDAKLEEASDLDFLDYVIKRGKIEEDPALKFNIKAIEKNIRAIFEQSNPIV